MAVLLDQSKRQRRLPRALPAVTARWQLLLPAALTLGLAFRAGGFFYGTTALLAVVLAILLVGRVTLARDPFAGWSPALAVAAGALALLATWTLLSAAWSDAPFRALSEFDRTLAYTLGLGLMGSFAARRGDLDGALRAVAGAFTVVPAAALVTRLFPDVFDATNLGKEPSRLAFPITYWNALGVACAIGMVLALHCTAGARQGVAARVLGAGALPVIATALYLTFSRGGIVAALLGVALYALLALPRRLPFALLTAGIALILASSQAAVYGAGAGLIVTCALQFVAGIGVTAFFTLWEVSLQEHVPGEALSRVSSFDYLASTILMPVGTAVAGPLAAEVGTQETLLGMSAVGIACALAFLAVPSVRRLPRAGATVADQ